MTGSQFAGSCTQHSALSTQHSALSTEHSALSTQHSALSPQSSVLSPQSSALSSPPARPLRAILEDDPLGHQLVADAVGLGEVARFPRGVARLDHPLDVGV